MSVDHEAHGLLAGYALHAISPEERERVERHLPECEECRRDLWEFRETGACLAEAVAEEPPGRTWEAIRARVAGTGRTPPRGEAPSPATLTGARRSRGPFRPRASWFVAAASLAAAALMGGLLAAQQQRVSELESHTAEVEALLAASDTRVAEERMESVSAEATVYASQRRDMVMVVVTGMPPAPDGMGYQLWYVDTGDDMRPAGMLRPSGGGKVLTAMASDLGEARQIGITMEPAGGAPEPSKDPMKVDVAR